MGSKAEDAVKDTVKSIGNTAKSIVGGTKAGQMLGIGQPKIPKSRMRAQDVVDPLAGSNILEALELGRRRRAMASGRQSTIRTTPLGLTQRTQAEERQLTGI